MLLFFSVCYSPSAICLLPSAIGLHRTTLLTSMLHFSFQCSHYVFSFRSVDVSSDARYFIRANTWRGITGSWIVAHASSDMMGSTLKSGSTGSALKWSTIATVKTSFYSQADVRKITAIFACSGRCTENRLDRSAYSVQLALLSKPANSAKQRFQNTSKIQRIGS